MSSAGQCVKCDARFWKADVALDVVAGTLPPASKSARVGKRMSSKSVDAGSMVIKIVEWMNLWACWALKRIRLILNAGGHPFGHHEWSACTGSGKTTTSAKLQSGFLTRDKRKVLMASLDVPAAAASGISYKNPCEQIGRGYPAIVAGQMPCRYCPPHMKCRTSWVVI